MAGVRGPWSNGHVSAPGETNSAGLPLHWSETENVKWKTPIPYRGWSTPVVLGGQVWLTTATEDGHEFFVLCVDAATGKILCNEQTFSLRHAGIARLGGDRQPQNSYATPSPVIEPGRVYVSFGSLWHGLPGHRHRQSALATARPALLAITAGRLPRPCFSRTC